MAIVNHAKREINAKIVFYGSAGTGKTTSLRYIYDRIKPSLRGEFKVLPASGSSLLFFDFSPFEQPVFAGYRLRLHVYTLQGQVDNSAAWKMTLKGTDGLMIVADAGKGIDVLQQSVVEVRDFLGAYGMGLDTIPSVLQLNKADLAGTINQSFFAREAGVDERGVSLTTAITGEGVLEAVTTLSRMVMERIREREDLAQEKSGSVDSTMVTEKTSVTTVEDVAMADGAGNCNPESQPDAHADSREVFVCVAQDLIAADNNTIRIPLDLSWQGARHRVVVSVAVSFEQVRPDAC